MPLYCVQPIDINIHRLCLPPHKKICTIVILDLATDSPVAQVEFCEPTHKPKIDFYDPFSLYIWCNPEDPITQSLNKISKNPLWTFCCIQMWQLCAKSQLSRFKTVRVDRVDRMTTPPTSSSASGKIIVWWKIFLSTDFAPRGGW